MALAARLRARFCTLIGAHANEAAAALTGFVFFLCLFCGYFMLRPLRETMGVQAGVDQLQWLFTATFVAMCAAVPLFGLLSARVQRARLIDITYGFFALNLAAFAVAFTRANQIESGARVNATANAARLSAKKP